jgi:hypothetical protein
MADEVTVSLPALKRAWRATGEESVWVRVQTKSPLEVAAAASQAAMIAANDTESEATDGEPRISGSGVSLTPQGPVILVDFCDEAAALESWLAQVAVELSARGITGKLGPIRTDTSSIDNETRVTVTTAALTVPIDWTAFDHDVATLHGAVRGWYADTDLTAKLVARLVRWCLFPGPVYLRHRVAQFRIAPEQAEPFVTAALRAGPPVILTCATDDGDFHQIAFDLHGQVTLTRRRSGQTWEQDVASLERILTDVAPLLEQGLIRRSDREASWDATVNNALQSAPYGGEGILHGLRLTTMRKLFARRTVDAYGIQILTDKHLSNAHDLSHWDIQNLGNGRHLVRAHDLSPWYTHDTPDAQTLAQARDDFGDLILNPQVVKADSTPTG